MISLFPGDNATTGCAIALQAGILPPGADVSRPRGQTELLALLQSYDTPAQESLHGLDGSGVLRVGSIPSEDGVDCTP